MKKSKGITLIALVITIIVLLILAGITIVSLIGDNGILGRTEKARLVTEQKAILEELKLKAHEKVVNMRNDVSQIGYLKENGYIKEDITEGEKIFYVVEPSKLDPVPKTGKGNYTKGDVYYIFEGDLYYRDNKCDVVLVGEIFRENITEDNETEVNGRKLKIKIINYLTGKPIDGVTVNIKARNENTDFNVKVNGGSKNISEEILSSFNSENHTDGYIVKITDIPDEYIMPMENSDGWYFEISNDENYIKNFANSDCIYYHLRNNVLTNEIMEGRTIWEINALAKEWDEKSSKSIWNNEEDYAGPTDEEIMKLTNEYLTNMEWVIVLQPKRKLTIKLVDAESGDVIDGEGKIQIYEQKELGLWDMGFEELGHIFNIDEWIEENASLRNELTINGTYDATNIIPEIGTYCVKMIQPPEGYSSRAYVNRAYRIEGKNIEEWIIHIYKEKYLDIEIQDAETGEIINSSETCISIYGIYMSEGEEFPPTEWVEEFPENWVEKYMNNLGTVWTENGNYTFEDVVENTYCIKMIEAPEGYELNPENTFYHVENNEKIHVYVCPVNDIPDPTPEY